MTDLPVVLGGFRPGVQARGLERGDAPIADVLRPCGHHQRAEGRQAVIALLGHTRTCPDCQTPAPVKEAA